MAGSSEVRFTNSYHQKIFVAYSRLDHGCGDDCGDPWEVKGWVNLEPGETQSRANPTESQWFYYYAEATDGAFWAGEFITRVVSSAFSTCTCLGSSDPSQMDVGMRELDTAAAAGVNFTP